MLNALKDFMAIQNDNLDAPLDVLPTGKFEHEEEPVKPARKRRIVQTATKTKPDNVDKPLQEREMESGKEEESSPDQSKSVKVGQTDLASISPIRPTRPTRPTRPISPEKDSEAIEI
jgi:hypothetical protein